MIVTQDSLEALGDMLYRRRIHKDMTQKKVADIAGISHVTVCRMERAGIVSPRFADVAGVCEALGLEIEIREKKS